MHATTSDDRDYRLWVLLRQTKDLLSRARQKDLTAAGISPIEAAVLFAVDNSTGLKTPADISRWLLREHHSTSALLQRMEGKGLITRTKDLPHRHLVRIAMTRKGQAAYKHATRRDSIRKLMTLLSDDEKQQLEASLMKLRQAALVELGNHDELPYP